mmetsp:Transcript_21256/g.48688  ORF Transcript_21256/g.48688 Transcript_21256/m.48688 type:complete len:261 (+) Transcript_21256:187-969(+)
MASMGVLVSKQTVLVRRCPIVILVHPHVAGEFHPDFHRQSFMICLRFVLIWVVVCDGWPQDCAAFNGRHGDPEVIEPRAPPPLRRVEIHEESVDARPLGGEVTGILVMMPSVELADVIPDDLEWLHVANRRADEVGDAFCDAIGQRVAVTLVAGAPALVARAHRRQRVARETSLEMRRARRDEGSRFRVVDEVLQRDHPRRLRVGIGRLTQRLGAVLREVAQDPAHRLLDRPRDDRRRRVRRPVAHAPLLLAHLARGGAR